MEQEPLSELTAADAALLELGIILGQNHAFGTIAGRCSAAQAEVLRRVRENKIYKRCCEKWEDFCPRYLKMGRSAADRTIALFEEFGPAYFELSQLTRVSPDTFRAIQPAIRDGALHYQGEVIELLPENSPQVAAAVAELRRAIPSPATTPPGLRDLIAEIESASRDLSLVGRIDRLDRACTAIVVEFEKISNDRDLASARVHLHSALTRARDELNRVAIENGLA
jgi:hypothetical protein